MLNKDLINRKIRNIQEYLEKADPVLLLPENDIVSNYEKLGFLERLFQLTVDTMLDINIHYIRELNLETPDDLRNTFVVLAENKILPYDFGFHLAPLVNLRNMLIHGYEKVDQRKFVGDFQKNRADFDTYLNFIKELLNKKGS